MEKTEQDTVTIEQQGKAVTTNATDAPKSARVMVSRAALTAHMPRPNWNQDGLSDPAAGRVPPLPSQMKMGAKMELHSHLAINLFRGRRGDPDAKRRPIYGLARFARQIAMVWSAVLICV